MCLRLVGARSIPFLLRAGLGERLRFALAIHSRPNPMGCLAYNCDDLLYTQGFRVQVSRLTCGGCPNLLTSVFQVTPPGVPIQALMQNRDYGASHLARPDSCHIPSRKVSPSWFVFRAKRSRYADVALRSSKRGGLDDRADQNYVADTEGQALMRGRSVTH